MPFIVQAQKFSKIDKSPMDQAKYPISNRVKQKLAIITYSRPQLKGRSFSDIVPQNKVWRTGANEATQVKFFSNIQIEETIIPAGEYTIFTIIDKNEITFILNTATHIWGAYSYDSENDVLRVKVPINQAKTSLEAFSIAFAEENDEYCNNQSVPPHNCHTTQLARPSRSPQRCQHHRTKHPGDAVNRKHIQCVVDPQLGLDQANRFLGDNCGNCTNHDSIKRPDIPRRRCDSCKTRDRARDHTNDSETPSL